MHIWVSWIKIVLLVLQLIFIYRDFFLLWLWNTYMYIYIYVSFDDVISFIFVKSTFFLCYTDIIPFCGRNINKCFFLKYMYILSLFVFLWYVLAKNMVYLNLCFQYMTFIFIQSDIVNRMFFLILLKFFLLRNMLKINNCVINYRILLLFLYITRR